jgi:hypothetical protein
MAEKYIWQMIKEAVEKSESKIVSNAEIREYIQATYGDVNKNSINAQILSSCVNKECRTNWPENSKPRKCNSNYDFLFSIGRGQVTLFDPQEHGEWELKEDFKGKIVVRKVGDLDVPENNPATQVDNGTNEFEFTFESQLRDFIAKNLSLIDSNLSVYSAGVEFKTDIGYIDILATDNNNGFVVIELKLSRGEDAALGQILRYIGWVKRHLANDASVKGIIIAKNISDKLLYAVSVVDNVSLYEYLVNFEIKKPISMY